jgi:hypothetical protein
VIFAAHATRRTLKVRPRSRFTYRGTNEFERPSIDRKLHPVPCLTYACASEAAKRAGLLRRRSRTGRCLPATAAPHRSRPNLSTAWQICGKFLAVAFFTEPHAATSPSRLCRNENLRNPLCLNVAARLVGAVNVRIGWFRPTRLKPFPSFGILRRPVRRARGAAARMLHKCLSGRRISRAICAGCLPCGSSASSVTLFLINRAQRARELPSVRRNALEVCRKTR